MTQSKYTYDEFEEVLINKENLTSFKELDEFEAIHTYRRLTELALDTMEMEKNFNIKHLKDIHSYIFQDVYLDSLELEEAGYEGKLPLRGEFRNENIAKGNFQFASAMFISNSLSYLLEEELKKDKFLRGLPLEVFVKKITYYLAELNVIHPFREGNGRSTREFIRQLSLEAGYILDWSLLNDRKDEFMTAMIYSVSNTNKLERIIAEITHINN